MGGNSESGRPGGPEGSAWKDEAGNNKQESDAEAIKHSNDINAGEQGWRELAEKHGVKRKNRPPRFSELEKILPLLG